MKEVKVGRERYIVCHNEAEAENDRVDRQAIVAGLETQLKKGDKALIGNSAYLRYRDLTRVEALFRAAKASFDTRPIFHQSDAATRGHVFCSFLALLLAKELTRLNETKGLRLE